VREALPERVAVAAARLDQFLSSFGGSKNAELWTVWALAHAPEWKQVRDLAGEVLREMSEWAALEDAQRMPLERDAS
jgi:Ser/Thr protein kinase RdoA (MazF antagonist)